VHSPLPGMMSRSLRAVSQYNTAGGIVVAVPAMIFHRYFRGRIDNFIVDMEQQAIKLVEIIHGERQS
jgi:biopolymer transport protein ExbB